MSTYNKNGATVTITPTVAWTSVDKNLTADQVNSGFNTSSDIISFSGRSKRNKPTVIAKVVVTVDSGKFFSVAPYLNTKSRKISIRLRDRVKAEFNNAVKNICYTSFTYDLIFISDNKSTGTSGLSADIKYVTKTIPTVATEIRAIEFGSSEISSLGELRSIRVIGEPDAAFALAINENQESTQENNLPSIFNKVNDESILNKRYSETTTYNYGKNMRMIKSTIPKSGTFSFSQDFPSTIVRKTAISVAASSASKIKFTNLSGVRAGDRMYYDGLANTSVVTVNVLDPDGNDPNECTLLTNGSTASITLAKGKAVEFKRNRVYSIDIIPDLTSTLGSQIPTTDPEYRLYQYLDPTLTITHKPDSTSGTETKILKYNDVATSLGRSADHTITYTGKANTLQNPNDKKVKSNFSVKLEIVCDPSTASPAHTFTAKTTPIFSNVTRRVHATTGTGAVNTNAVMSNWTNSISEFNGGTVLKIKGIRFSAIGSGTIILNYDVDILRWGNKDVNMELDLATVLTNA